MPFDSTTPIPAATSLSERARAAMMTRRDVPNGSVGAATEATNPRHGNTGGSSGQPQSTQGESDARTQLGDESVPQTTPPLQRRSRAKGTSPEMAEFLKCWFFDWLAVTMPNGSNGKGSKTEGPRGEQESVSASNAMFLWATLQGLRLMRIGRGTDGYQGGAHLAFDPTASDRVATIRDGHATNMPSLELPGAQGQCAKLAPKALAELGPVLISRVDSSCDLSQEGLWDDLDELCCEMAIERDMDMPHYDGSPEKGRTLYFGKGEVSVKIYEKDLERLASGVKDEADVDRNLVRIEFTFRPKKGKKAGLAKISRDDGPGALLGTVNWVRHLTERLAVMTQGTREDAATMAVTRVSSTPDPRPIRAKAQHGAEQYAPTFCKAAIAEIVEKKHGGDWLAAEIEPDEVVEVAVDMVKVYIRNAAGVTLENLGVLEVLNHEQEAARAHDRLDLWLREQRQASAEARFALKRAADRAYEMCGVAA